MTRRNRLVAILVAAIVLVVAPAAAAAAVSISALPILRPAFNSAITDYATRCLPGGSVTMFVTAPAGSPVSVDGGTAKTGAFSTKVALGGGQRFSFTVGAGADARTYNVRCLPEGFPSYSVSRYGPVQAAYYLLTPTPSETGPFYVVMVDHNGVPVWWMKSPGYPDDFKLLPDGTLAWHSLDQQLGIGFASQPGDHWEVRRLDGSLVRTLFAVGSPTDLHELQLLGNGDYIVTSFRPRDGVDLSAFGMPLVHTVLDGVIQEITPAGALVWQWNSADWIDPAEGARWSTRLRLRPLPDGRTALDWRHLNSVEPDGNGYLVSIRHTDAIYRIDRATGAIDWKLGGTPTAKSLRIVGDPNAAGDFGGQHDARRLPDGTITLYDNGTWRNRPPRALRFRIDPVARTATLVDSITDPEATFSWLGGSARKLPGGDWVVAWGATPIVSETTAEGTPLMRLRFGYTYRAEPVLPGQLSAAAIRAAMDAMNPR